MSRAPRLSLLPSHDVSKTPLGIPAPSRGQTGRKLLNPSFVEVGVAVADVLLILAAGLLSSLAYGWVSDVRIGELGPYAGLGIVIAVNFAAFMMARRNYRLKNLMLWAKQAREATLIWSGTYGLLALVGFTMKISSEYSRGAVIFFFAGGLAALLVWHHIVASLMAASLAKGLFAGKKIIVIAEQGRCDSSRSLIELLRYGYHPTTICEISRDELARPGIPASLNSKLADIIHVARNERIEAIYLLLHWRNERTIDGILDALAILPISVHLMPDDSASRFLNHPIANVGDTWSAVLRPTPLTRAEQMAKRSFDIVLATAGLVSMVPLMLMTGALIKLDSRGPILFRQKRNGFNGRTFEILKFRTMHVLENGPAVRQVTRNDPRVTRVGRLLRRSSIDELPQLFNVLSGEMSLVGPRPHAISHNDEYEKLIANYAFRHHVKPGLTGWAQVNGYRGETRQIEQMKRRVEHDLWYINNWSPWLDLRIIFQTMFAVLRQPTAY